VLRVCQPAVQRPMTGSVFTLASVQGVETLPMVTVMCKAGSGSDQPNSLFQRKTLVYQILIPLP